MDKLQHFSLPISGLKNELHEYTFEIDDDFFAEFDQNLVKKGKFVANVDVDKRSNHIILHTKIKGFVETNCDRCLADIHLPVIAESTLHVKPGNPDESDDEVMFIKEEDTSLNLAGLLYENILVSVPLIKIYDCESEDIRPCNDEVLKYLTETGEQKEDDGDTINIFKDIKL